MTKVFLSEKKYTDFANMHEDCQNILKDILTKHSFIEINDLLKNVRNSCGKNILNSYFIVGHLPQYVVNSIESKTVVLKFSVDSLLKNIIEHPEITVSEYEAISKYILDAEYIFLKNKKNLIYFKIADNIYQFVVKSTQNKQENFLTTFHKASGKQLEKDLKRYKSIKK